LSVFEPIDGDICLSRMKKCINCNRELSKRQTKYCSNKCKYANASHHHPSNTNIKNNPNERIRCVVDGKVFKDVNNISGALSRYSKNVLGKEYDRSDWVVFTVPDKPTLNCPYCDWSTIDIDNKSGCFTTHLEKKHNKTFVTLLEEHPMYSDVFSIKTNRAHSLSSESVECMLCGESFFKITNTHLITHGYDMDRYKIEFPNADILTPSLIELQSKYTTEQNMNRVGTFRSSGEVAVAEYIENELGVDLILNSREFGFELDMFSPEHNIAIEYNGLLWHSEVFGGKDNKYHLNKTKECERKGIHLIHIFEDEWLDMESIVKSKLANMFGRPTKVIYGRKCTVDVLSPVVASEFLSKYHIQGNGRSNYKYGLYFGDELVAVATFSKLRRSLGSVSSLDTFELSRYASKYKCIGGLDKMMAMFAKDMGQDVSVISYGDRRWTKKDDNIYEKTGWEFVGASRPSYWYLSKSRRGRIHRYSMTKHKLVEMGGNPNMTEFEIAQSMGYDRVWDCGTVKYIKKINLKKNTK
jgi:hypothetical protein